MTQHKIKRQMSEREEFEIMKLVLDKFLWLGFLVMGWGLFVMLRDAAIDPGIWYMITGVILLLVFVAIITKEYEIIK